MPDTPPVEKPKPPPAELVRRMAMFGYAHDCAQTHAFLRAPVAHIQAWLRTGPTPRDIKRLLAHLERLTQDSAFPFDSDHPYTLAHHLALRRQFALLAFDTVVDQLVGGAGIEALYHRDHLRGLKAIAAPRELLRALAILAPLADDLPIGAAESAYETEVAQALDEYARSGIGVDAMETALPGGVSVRVVARPLARCLQHLEQLWAGSAAHVLVPIAGNQPTVVDLSVTCVFGGGGADDERDQEHAGDERDHRDHRDPGDRGRGSGRSDKSDRHARIHQDHRSDRERAADAHVERSVRVNWLGLHVSGDTRESVARTVSLLWSRKLIASAALPVSRLVVFVRECAGARLDPSLSGVTGRSLELGALVAAAAAADGRVLPERWAATGQVNPRSAAIEPVTGLREKVSALAALELASGAVGERAGRATLLCPRENVSDAERAASGVSFDLAVKPIASIRDLSRLGLLRDPWEPYLRAVRDTADAAARELRIEDSTREDWRARLLALEDAPEQVVVVPAPFGLEGQLDAWMQVVAGLLAELREDRLARAPAGSFGAVPVVLRPRPNDPSMLPAIERALTDACTQGVRDAAVTTVGLARETWSNAYKTPRGFWLIVSDPADDSPIVPRDGVPPHRHLTLTRRHPAYRHRWCFVASDLHQLTRWKTARVLDKL